MASSFVTNWNVPPAFITVLSKLVEVVFEFPLLPFIPPVTVFPIISYPTLAPDEFVS